MKPKLTTRILKYLLIVSAAIAVAIALIWITLQGYSAPWTGFGDYTNPNGEFVRDKTLWDWMQLFIIPIFLGVGLFWLNRAERKNERLRSEERAKLEREIATDRQQEAVLQTYLDRMANLLLDENLHAPENDKVHNVARIRTLTVLRGLDWARKGMVIKFLHEAKLINKSNPLLHLNGAELQHTDMIYGNLQGANLEQTFLNDSMLAYVDLRSANLQYTYLSSAVLAHAKLEGAKLTGAQLQYANLFYADLSSADLSGANLNGVNLNGADLSSANLSSADLSGAKLSHAKLNDADLRGAKLNSSDIYEPSGKHTRLDAVDLGETDLNGAKLEGATMPDGTIHD